VEVRLVVGLGNPGDPYRRTRHNAGFMALDLLASRARAKGREDQDAWCAETRIGDEPVLLVKPLSFMNLSGVPVARILAEHGATPADLVVLVDDVALDTGRIRVRARGGHGGHNGLRSIVEELGTEEFVRVRIGIGKAELPVDLASYVLSDFTPDEVPVVGRAVSLAADAAEWVVREGAESAMNRFNAPAP
jgi:peptidyl-tRNA hydrolase, PTH1 family